MLKQNSNTIAGKIPLTRHQKNKKKKEGEKKRKEGISTTPNLKDVSWLQTAQLVTGCNCEMLIRKSGWWIDCELAMSWPSPVILHEGVFFFF